MPVNVALSLSLSPYPRVPQMTKCGHVFCRHCLLQYFDDDTGRKWKKCPICVELISCEDSQLKSTALELVVPCKPGDSRTFVLVERMRHSTLAALRQPGEGPIGSLLYETDPSAKFSRIAIAEAVSARIDHQSLELLARAREAQQSQDLSYPYLLHVMQQMQVSNVARVASESAAQPASKPPREKRVSSNSPWSDSEDEAEPATPEVDAAASAAAAPLLDDEDAAATTATTTTTTTTTTARQPVRLSSVAESDRTLYYQCTPASSHDVAHSLATANTSASLRSRRRATTVHTSFDYEVPLATLRLLRSAAAHVHGASARDRGVLR